MINVTRFTIPNVVQIPLSSPPHLLCAAHTWASGKNSHSILLLSLPRTCWASTGLQTCETLILLRERLVIKDNTPTLKDLWIGTFSVVEMLIIQFVLTCSFSKITVCKCNRTGLTPAKRITTNGESKCIVLNKLLFYQTQPHGQIADEITLQIHLNVRKLGKGS